MTLLLALIAGLALSDGGRAQAQPPESKGYARSELLVDTAWLAQHLNDSNTRIVDIRARGYGDGHIPEAVFVDAVVAVGAPQAAPSQTAT